MLLLLQIRKPQRSTPFPYTTLFRSSFLRYAADGPGTANPLAGDVTRIYTFTVSQPGRMLDDFRNLGFNEDERSEEHTSELQSHVNIVCRLLLEKENENITSII